MRIFSVVFLIFILVHTFSTSFSASRRLPTWANHINKKMPELEKSFEGEFGILIQDLESGEIFAHNAEKFWYLSSTVKVPIAIALLKMVDEKKVDLAEKVSVQKSDYRDGAGPVNWFKPGDKASYRYLLDQMLIYSDNAASDLIIEKVGLENVNKVVEEFAIAEEFGKITTLLDVRKKAYSEFHPDAAKLSNHAFFAIKKKRGKRLKELASQLKIPKAKLKYQNMDEGFDLYYDKHWNSATLFSYAQLLRNLIDRKILSKESTQKLLTIMSGIQTGKKRIRKGLAKHIYFAHKTGTQHKQACDIGIASTKASPKPKALILVCTKKWKKLSHAAKLMEKVGRLVSQSGLLPVPTQAPNKP